MLHPRVAIVLIWSVLTMAAQPVDVLPSRASDGAIPLHGTWSFRYLAGLDAKGEEAFRDPSFQLTGWSTITVPGHWELQGFAEPRYADAVAEGLGKSTQLLVDYHATAHALNDAPDDAALLERLHALQEELDAAQAWTLQNRVETTLTRLQALYAAPPEVLQRDVIAFLERLQAAGLIEVESVA